MLNSGQTEIKVKGKPVLVPAVTIDGTTVIATGSWIKTAALFDEGLLEGQPLRTPDSFVEQLRHTSLKADIFTFSQRLPDTTPKYEYHLEWDNVAVIPITTFAEWWDTRAEYDVRKAVKRSRRLGLVVKEAEFDNDFVEGICRIYNDSPIRQGKAFWHYKKDVDTVKQENATYLGRSAFIGAYYEEQLIGFIKMVYVGSIATTLQVISQKKHFDKKPMNALIAKAVEICALKNVSHLVYGSYAYNGVYDSLTEFKRRNGFEQVLVPRFYIPLSAKGAIALKLKLHHGFAHRMPRHVIDSIRKCRAAWFRHKFQSSQQA